MRELADGRWEIDSAFEADRIGRAAVHGRDDAERLFLNHRAGELPYTNDEIEFFRREQQYGKLVISRELAARAEAGLRASVVPRLRAPEHEQPRLNPYEAAVLLGALTLSRLSDEEAVQLELSAIEAQLSQAPPPAGLQPASANAA